MEIPQGYRLAGLLVAMPDLPEGPSQARAYSVESVSDGDTFSVGYGGETFWIRLAGIDAPEKGQPYGEISRTILSGLIGEGEVQLVPLGSDKYKRTVAYVFNREGIEVSARMVHSGAAWWYRDYAENRKDLEALQADARSARRGLWVEKAPIPPWQWRGSQRKK